MEAAEREARIAEATRALDDAEFEPELEARTVDVPIPRSAGGLLRLTGSVLVRLALFVSIFVGLQLWLGLDEDPDKTGEFWDDLLRRRTLVELAVVTLSTLPFLIRTPLRRGTRSIGSRRSPAIVIDLRASSVLSPGAGVVLQETDGEQTVYHVQEDQLDTIEPGMVGVALILHKRLLAFHPLAA